MVKQLSKKRNGRGGQTSNEASLRAYLQEYSLDDVPLTNIVDFLRKPNGTTSLTTAKEHLSDQGQNLSLNGGRIRLYVAEEQQIFRIVFQAFFSSHPAIDLLDATSNTSGKSLAEAAKALSPDIVLVGVKALQASTVVDMGELRGSHPQVPLVLLSSYYEMTGIKALREFYRVTSTGCAYLLKHTISTVGQLPYVFRAVAQGRVILDQAVMNCMLTGLDTTLLKELSPREIDVLSWMAKGARNDSIAEALHLELKTVEHYINSIYSKLGDAEGSRHPRVSAVLSYLLANGLLPADYPIEA